MRASLWLGLIGFCALIALIAAVRRKFLKKRRAKIFNQQFPQSWKNILENQIPLYSKLPGDLQSQLQGHIQVFLSEKNFVGHHGLEIDDEIRVFIAANACLLLLNRKTNYYPHLHNVLVYPSEFRHHAETSQHKSRLGESWLRGPLVLSWVHSKKGNMDAKDGSNVILHEFAHQLDQENGVADGLPILRHNKLLRWSNVLNREYHKLIQMYQKGRRAFIDEYGTTNPAEFFAVITEHFFEQAKLMNKKHPELYQELKKYYQVDPLSWVQNS